METVLNTERKNWLDNIRWITILLVVVFHVFFFYNNIGAPAIFQRLAANPSLEGEKASVTFAGIFQYSVYQWFMLLLFVVSGMCAKYTLRRKSLKEFLQSRSLKLLVPSTLGVITVHWIGGWLESSLMMSSDAEIPVFVRYIISVASGTGGLWFCHVLFFACLVLALIKVIDKKGKFEAFCEKSNIFVAVFLYFVMWGSAQILNVPKVTTYRMAYYPMGFLLGYYVFTSEKLLAQLKKFGWIFLAAGIAAGVFYGIKFYGTYYADYSVLNNWLSVLHAWLMVLGILGAAQVILNFENPFSHYMNKVSWGIYINHITLMILFNYFLRPVASILPVWVIYILELVVSLAASILFWEAFSRVPVVRFVLYGIKGEKRVKNQKKEKTDV